MKKAVFILAGMAVTATLNAQGGFLSPADTVYLQYGYSAVVHVKRIEPSKPGSISAYQIKTHESLDLTDSNLWTNREGGYQWKAEQFKEGFRSGEVKKVVFADGFVLPFEGGGLDRGLLLKAPSYKASHGDFMAEGVVPLTKDETRRLIGDEAYYLNYRVSKIQALAGTAKFIAGAAGGFICYLTRDYDIRMRAVPGPVGTNYLYTYNPFWNTGTPASIVTAVYGAAEMAVANISIRRLATTFRNYRAPSVGSFRTKAILGGGLLLAGGAATWWGFDRMAKDEGWVETYISETTANIEKEFKIKDRGEKLSVPWLLPAAGALLANFGLTELTNGLTGLSGYGKLRAAGLARAQLCVAPVPFGVGVSMVF